MALTAKAYHNLMSELKIVVPASTNPRAEQHAGIGATQSIKRVPTG